jgi:RNA-directed DNA polymerase
MTVNGPTGEALDWDTIVWPLHEDNVRRLRRRIFKATKARDLATVRNLQKMMLAELVEHAGQRATSDPA